MVKTRSYDRNVKFLKRLLNRLHYRFLAKRGGDDEQDPYNYPLLRRLGWRGMRGFRLRLAMMICVKA